MSDYHACDLLIELAGGIRRVDSCMAGLGIAPLHLSETEHSMHVDPRRCYNNRATPLAVATLLKRAYNENLLSPPYAELLKQAMLGTTTGPDKLRAGLPPQAKLAHKTGSSDRTAQGIKTADNDAGVFCLPDGRLCQIAVFIMESAENDAANARLTADIARTVYHILTDESGAVPSAP